MSENNIVLFGGGLHANFCTDLIEKEGRYNIIGIIDSVADVGSDLYGYRVIGRQEDLIRLMDEYNICGGLITIGDGYNRYRLSEFIKGIVPDFLFVSAIHPTVSIAKNVEIGVNAILKPNSVLNADAKIGDFCILGTGAQVEHNCTVGNFSLVSAGSIMGGVVNIGNFTSITLGVVIFDRVNIGDNVVVGSGSLIDKDIPDNVLVYGSPGKIIKEIPIGYKFLK